MQSDISKDDLLYAAGYLDGEGCFSTDGTGTTITVTCMTSHRPTIEWLHTTFGGSFSARGVKVNKPVFSWYVGGDNAYKVCQILRPYLREKREQADILVKHRELGQQPGCREITGLKTARQPLLAKLTELKHAHY